MFTLTNQQRKCFGLLPIQDHWVPMVLKPSPYHHHVTTAYLDGNVLRKCIMTGDRLYKELEICEELSEDLRYLMPKTAKGKPVLLSAASLEKKGNFGMCLYCVRDHRGWEDIYLYNATTQRNYYSNAYEAIRLPEREDFQNWVDTWCRETTPEDLVEISAFAAQPRQHVRFREGDVFRFRINRRLWGYGRILLDYARMRKEKIPFWDVLMTKPAACSVYHIATERKDVSIEELRHLKSLPSSHIMDNHLFYGEFEIIGNIPVSQQEDYPILYGSTLTRGHGTCLQCGTRFLTREEKGAFPYQFMNHGVSFDLQFTLPILHRCIEAGSNEPYWAQNNGYVNGDLRNPKFRAELETVCGEFGLVSSDLVLY